MFWGNLDIWVLFGTEAGKHLPSPSERLVELLQVLEFRDQAARV